MLESVKKGEVYSNFNGNNYKVTLQRGVNLGRKTTVAIL